MAFFFKNSTEFRFWQVAFKAIADPFVCRRDTLQLDPNQLGGRRRFRLQSAPIMGNHEQSIGRGLRFVCNTPTSMIYGWKLEWNEEYKIVRQPTRPCGVMKLPEFWTKTPFII